MNNIYCPKCKTWYLQQLKGNLQELICTKCGTHYQLAPITALDRIAKRLFK